MRSIEQIIGTRIRLRREALGMSQTELGRVLGLTYGQIQKYENANSRIGAGRLYRVAHHLRMPVEYFYRDMDFSAQVSLDDELAARLLEAFRAIDSVLVREKVLGLICSLPGELGPHLRESPSE